MHHQSIDYSHTNMGYLQTFLEEYIWYHAITLTIIILIAVLVAVHHLGSEQNLAVMK